VSEDISADLKAAYAATEYWVHTTAPFYFLIDRYSLHLAKLHQTYSCASSAFITAYNPFSVAHTDLQNTEANEKLCALLRPHCVAVLEGKGQDSERQWPAESSFLGLGISREQSCALGIEFQQNAIVYIGSDALPELILLR